MTFKDLRLKNKLSQAQLARAARLDSKTIFWIETGKVTDPRYGTVSAIAAVLGVTPAYLAAILGCDRAAA